MNKFNIAICGAGPVGLTLALLMIKRGFDPAHLVLIDAKTAEQAEKDRRTIALSYGSQQILQTASVALNKATEIHQIHVSRRGHFGRTLIDRTQLHVPALGYVCRYGDIITSLTTELKKHALTLLRPAKITSITPTATHVLIQLENQHAVETDIAIQAEGGLFGEQIPRTKSHDYHQTAIIAHVKTSVPIANRAFERFTDQGPLALLPQEDGYALVWCVHPDQATQLMALPDDAFLANLHTAFGERVGRFTHTTERAAFPLGLNVQTSLPLNRCISIGNAAQTLHPVAGQGLNLGLRDAFQLARFLPQYPVESTSLKAFFRVRQTDRNTTIHLTDQLAKSFASSPTGSLKQTFLSAGLALMDMCAPAQQLLAEQMMFGRRT